MDIGNLTLGVGHSFFIERYFTKLMENLCNLFEDFSSFRVQMSNVELPMSNVDRNSGGPLQLFFESQGRIEEKAALRFLIFLFG
jgi:hypothetical protein